MSIPSGSQWRHYGFWDPAQAEVVARRLERAAPGSVEVVAQMCAATADPDQALAAWTDLVDVADMDPIDPDDPGWVRLFAVLGGSAGLGRWLRQRPRDREVLFDAIEPWTGDAIREDVLTRVCAWLEEVPATDGASSTGLSAAAATYPGTHLARAIDELRWAYRRHLMRIASRDLTSADPAAELETTCLELSNLDDAVVACALRIAEAQVPEHTQVRLGVVALGKTGAQEANYLSDVDVLYVAEPAVSEGRALCDPARAVHIAGELAARIASICSSYTAAGTIWEVDANLRPEGSVGPLARTMAGMANYYTTWAENWEFQAMLKARPMAGDLELAGEFIDLVSPMVWSAAEKEGFVAEAQKMRARVVSVLPAGHADREIKLSAGGLRDTEFSVQMLQLVHGRADERLRVRATLPALRQLVAHGYVGRVDGPQLDRAYRLQRLLEHRLQLYHLKRTHLMPHDERGLRRLARAMGMGQADQVRDAWRESARTVLGLHQRLYFSPLLEAVARLRTDEVRLTPQAAAARLRALGYADPTAALRHIEALTTGMSRRAEILRQLLPALLGWMASGPNPDAGLLAFRQMAESLGSTPFFLRALRDEGELAQNLALVLSTSRYAASLLRRSPANVEILVGHDRSQLPGPEALIRELQGVVDRYGDDPRVGGIIRATRHRELLRIAMADILGDLDVTEVGQRLSALTDAIVQAGLDVATRQLETGGNLAIIALGRWGGAEVSYSSDADIIVVAADSEDSEITSKGARVLACLRGLLAVPGPDPDLVLDAGLRPEGRDGPLVRTLSSCLSYYGKWASPWEAHALVRARYGAGDEDLARSFLAGIDPIRYPSDGLTPTQLTEIRRLKARMESERIGRGVDPRDHLKLGPGGLSDVEWTVQLLQLLHAHAKPTLRGTGTLPVLEQTVVCGLVDPEDAEALRAAFLLASRIRNAIILLRGKPSDVLPADASERGQVAQVLGYPTGGGSHLAEDWYRAARRAKTVTDNLFWGGEA